MSSFNRIDVIRADAPDLAAYGSYAVGVRTIEAVNPHQIDVTQIVSRSVKPDAMPHSDRRLTLEVWYPAQADAKGDTCLRAIIRDGKTTVDLQGRAVRDAAPCTLPTSPVDKGFPLVIVSHGFPGNRYLLSPLAENLASKGYVVVAMDHLDTTYDSVARRQFSSALVHRPLDQVFTLNAIAKLSEDASSFLYKLADANHAAIVGYSMGGYGSLISAGASVTQSAVDSDEDLVAVPHGLLAVHCAESEDYQRVFDSRIKTIVPIAPWGIEKGVFDAEGLARIQVPCLFIAGSIDDVSGYETGVRAIWQAASGVQRSLLTFDNANHNAAGPMPAPLQAIGTSMANHYIDAVWDNVRMNNITQHFLAAWLGKHLKGDAAMDAYLAGGTFNKDDWKGFAPRTAKGLRWEKLEEAGKLAAGK